MISFGFTIFDVTVLDERIKNTGWEIIYQQEVNTYRDSEERGEKDREKRE